MYKNLLIVALLFVVSGGAAKSLSAQANSGTQSSASKQENPKITDQDIQLLRQDLEKVRHVFNAQLSHLIVHGECPLRQIFGLRIGYCSP